MAQIIFKAVKNDGTVVSNQSVVDVIGLHINGELDYAVSATVNNEHKMIAYLDAEEDKNATEGSGLYIYTHHHTDGNENSEDYSDFKFLGK